MQKIDNIVNTFSEIISIYIMPHTNMNGYQVQGAALYKKTWAYVKPLLNRDTSGFVVDGMEYITARSLYEIKIRYDQNITQRDHQILFNDKDLKILRVTHIGRVVTHMIAEAYAVQQIQ